MRSAISPDTSALSFNKLDRAGRDTCNTDPRSQVNISPRSGSKITPATISPALRERDVINGEAMREIRGAVQRIDVPAVFRGLSRVPAAFFGDDGVSGEMPLQALNHEPLGSAVGFPHQIEFALQLEADVALEVAVQQRAGFAGDFLANFQLRRHKGWRA
jgi:hypothetical protein